MKTKQHTVCDECRRRKLGCDGKQPCCSQCVLSGLSCPGYKKHIVFRQPSSPGSVASSQRKKRTRQSRAPNPASQRPKPPARALAWPLSDVLSLCIQNFVPANELGSMSGTAKPSQSRICGAWVEVLPGIVGTDGRHDGPLSSAIKALGISLMARGPKGRAPVHEAIAAHSSALKAVGCLIPHANDDPNNYNEISAAIMCLFLSEKFFPTSSYAATVHARGIGELIQLRPPHFYASGTPHKLFVGFRPILILHAFDTRKSTFLGAPEWKEEPFRRVVQDPLQSLLSEACAIPAIFEMLDHSNDNSESFTRKAVGQFMEAINRLDFWHKSANMTMGNFTRLRKGSPADTTGLEFPNITVANSLSHYWAFWIVCATQIQRLTAHHPNMPQDCVLIDGEHPASKATTQKVLQLATFILGSTGYLMREDMKLYGTASAFFPLHIARGALEMFGGGDEAISEQLARNAEVIRQQGYEDVVLHRRTKLLS
ncbi:hypothetical protein HER10_EVM0003112 [Colletotrichum scovillei]|uniref:N-terminal fungal transcription regulatory domain-containing protein n=1 Tax=Colletotrichum scovillei TaxID=1209932 RepID=A0A9P7QVM6_9PEZI|nr:uncharacterized protein HER10_EVM0003112 [Colletotrichum scovillei]KAF4778324.1 hypothetical protein HER10_EVM0003112 [Colletotrichum scovillei]KAG7043982.1 n-terminal fungal transcription regulatory domain-containing protein [Colletotrichum scovillei]KAG7046083.1 n-terminal fungal transcription regulatory domain-containing protein [Colletotrichum scovillei]KAG7063431.1 n-terminal fungal transcription regulatory domain-containing protein [Colletotrichum scovillei]